MAENVVSVQGIPVPPPIGRYVGASAVTTGTIITLPANGVWYGYFTLSANLDTAATKASPNIHTVTAGAIPDPATKILELRIETTTAITEAHETGVTPYMFIYAPAAGCTVQLETSTANDVTGTAYGFLVS